MISVAEPGSGKTTSVGVPPGGPTLILNMICGRFVPASSQVETFFTSYVTFLCARRNGICGRNPRSVRVRIAARRIEVDVVGVRRRHRSVGGRNGWRHRVCVAAVAGAVLGDLDAVGIRGGRG